MGTWPNLLPPLAQVSGRLHKHAMVGWRARGLPDCVASASICFQWTALDGLVGPGRRHKLSGLSRAVESLGCVAPVRDVLQGTKAVQVQPGSYPRIFPVSHPRWPPCFTNVPRRRHSTSGGKVAIPTRHRAKNHQTAREQSLADSPTVVARHGAAATAFQVALSRHQP